MKLRALACVAAVSGCYMNPPPSTSTARTVPVVSNSGEKLVMRLAYAASSAAAAGDCATVKAIAPVAARADAAAYHVTFEANPNIEDCLAGKPPPTSSAPAVAPVASEPAPEPVHTEPVPEPAPAAETVPAPTAAPETKPAPAPAQQPQPPPLAPLSSRALHTAVASDSSSRWSAQRRFAVALSGVGVATLGISLWAVIDASAKRDQAQQLGCSPDLSSCSASALPTAQAAYARGNLATATFIGGSALVAIGAYLWFTDPKPQYADRQRWHVAPTGGPGNLGVVIGGGF